MADDFPIQRFGIQFRIIFHKLVAEEQLPIR